MAKGQFDFESDDFGMDFDFDNFEKATQKSRSFVKEFAAGVVVGAAKKMGKYIPAAQDTYDEIRSAGDTIRDQVVMLTEVKAKLRPFVYGIKNDATKWAQEIKTSKGLKEKLFAIEDGFTRIKKNIAYTIDPDAVMDMSMSGEEDETRYGYDEEGNLLSDLPATSKDVAGEAKAQIEVQAQGFNALNKSMGGIIDAVGASAALTSESIISTSAKGQAQQAEIFQRTAQLLTTQHVEKMNVLSSIAKMGELQAKFHGEVLGPLTKQNNEYFKKISAQLQDIYNWKKNAGSEEFKNMANIMKAKNKHFGVDKLVSYSGGFNVNEMYKRLVSQARESTAGGMIEMLVGMKDMLPMLLTSGDPMSLPKWMGSKLGGLMMAPLKGAAGRLSDKIQRSMMPIVGNLNYKAKNSNNDFIKGFADLLGLDTTSKRTATVLTENRRASFDMITRKSIVEVIPGYLARILQAVSPSGSELQVFDHGTGRFTSVKNMQKKMNSQLNTAGMSSLGGYANSIGQINQAHRNEARLSPDEINEMIKDIVVSGTPLNTKTAKAGVFGSKLDLKKQTAFFNAFKRMSSKDKLEFINSIYNAKGNRNNALDDLSTKYLEYGLGNILGDIQGDDKIFDIRNTQRERGRSSDFEKLMKSGLNIRKTLESDEWRGKKINVSDLIEHVKDEQTIRNLKGESSDDLASMLAILYKYKEDLDPKSILDLFSRGRGRSSGQGKLFNNIATSLDNLPIPGITKFTDKIRKFGETRVGEGIETARSKVNSFFDLGGDALEAAALGDKKLLNAKLRRLGRIFKKHGLDLKKLGSQIASLGGEAAKAKFESQVDELMERMKSGDFDGIKIEGKRLIQNALGCSLRQASDILSKVAPNIDKMSAAGIKRQAAGFAKSLNKKIDGLGKSLATSEFDEKFREAAGNLKLGAVGLVKTSGEFIQITREEGIGAAIDNLSDDMKAALGDDVERLQKAYNKAGVKGVIQIFKNTRFKKKLDERVKAFRRSGKNKDKASIEAQAEQMVEGGVTEDLPFFEKYPGFKKFKDAVRRKSWNIKDFIATAVADKVDKFGRFLFGDGEKEAPWGKNGVVGWAKEKLDSTLDKVKKWMFGNKEEGKKGIFQKIMNPFLSVMEGIRHRIAEDFFLPLRDALKPLALKTRAMFRKLFGGIRDGLKKLWNRGKKSKTFGRLFRGVERVAGGGKNFLKKVGGAAYGVLKSPFSLLSKFSQKQMDDMLAKGEISQEEYDQYMANKGNRHLAETNKHAKRVVEWGLDIPNGDSDEDLRAMEAYNENAFKDAKKAAGQEYGKAFGALKKKLKAGEISREEFEAQKGSLEDQRNKKIEEAKTKREEMNNKLLKRGFGRKGLMEKINDGITDIKTRVKDILEGVTKLVKKGLGMAATAAFAGLSALPLIIGGASIVNKVKSVISRFKKGGAERGIESITGELTGGLLGTAERDTAFNEDGTMKSGAQRALDRVDLGRNILFHGRKAFWSEAKKMDNFRKVGAKAYAKAMKNAGQDVVGNAGFRGKIIGALKKVFEKFFKNPAIQKAMKGGPVGRICNAIYNRLGNLGTKMIGKMGKTAVGKTIKGALSVMSGGIGFIVFAVTDFLRGMGNAGRYFSVAPKDISHGMRVTAGLVECMQGLVSNALSAFIPGAGGLLAGMIPMLLPTDWMVETFYKFMATDDERQRVQEAQNELKERADQLGINPKQLAEMENPTFGKRVFDGAKKLGSFGWSLFKKSPVGRLIDGTAKSIKAFTENIKKEGLAKTIGRFAAKANNKARQLGDNLRYFAHNWKDILRDKILEITEGIRKVASAVWEKITAPFKAVKAAFDEFREKWKEEGFIGAAKHAFGRIKDGFVNIWKKVWDKISGPFRKIAGWFSKQFGLMKEGWMEETDEFESNRSETDKKIDNLSKDNLASQSRIDELNQREYEGRITKEEKDERKRLQQQMKSNRKAIADAEKLKYAEERERQRLAKEEAKAERNKPKFNYNDQTKVDALVKQGVSTDKIVNDLVASGSKHDRTTLERLVNEAALKKYGFGKIHGSQAAVAYFKNNRDRAQAEIGQAMQRDPQAVIAFGDKIAESGQKTQNKDIGTLSPEFRGRVQAFLNDPRVRGQGVSIREARRSPLTQLAYYSKERAPDSVTDALMIRSGTSAGRGFWASDNRDIVTGTLASNHFDGNAVDLEPGRLGYAKLGQIAAEYGISWGGNWSGKFKDPPHFELDKNAKGNFKSKNPAEVNANAVVASMPSSSLESSSIQSHTATGQATPQSVKWINTAAGSGVNTIAHTMNANIGGGDLDSQYSSGIPARRSNTQIDFAGRAKELQIEREAENFRTNRDGHIEAKTDVLAEFYKRGSERIESAQKVDFEPLMKHDEEMTNLLRGDLAVIAQALSNIFAYTQGKDKGNLDPVNGKDAQNYIMALQNAGKVAHDSSSINRIAQQYASGNG